MRLELLLARRWPRVDHDEFRILELQGSRAEMSRRGLAWGLLRRRRGFYQDAVRLAAGVDVVPHNLSRTVYLR